MTTKRELTEHEGSRARRSGRTAYVLTTLAAITMASAAAGGVFATDWLYRDNALIAATFRGQDIVTLVVAVPLLLIGLVLEMKGSQRGRMLWLGMLFFTMYAYLFYAVAAAFNQFFLLYVATFGLPLYAVLFSVPRLDLDQLGNAMGGTIARAVSTSITPGLLASGSPQVKPTDERAPTADLRRRLSRRGLSRWRRERD